MWQNWATFPASKVSISRRRASVGFSQPPWSSVKAEFRSHSCNHWAGGKGGGRRDSYVTLLWKHVSGSPPQSLKPVSNGLNSHHSFALHWSALLPALFVVAAHILVSAILVRNRTARRSMILDPWFLEQVSLLTRYACYFGFFCCQKNIQHASNTRLTVTSCLFIPSYGNQIAPKVLT